MHDLTIEPERRKTHAAPRSDITLEGVAVASGWFQDGNTVVNTVFGRYLGWYVSKSRLPPSTFKLGESVLGPRHLQSWLVT